jgi:hypothetical protein
MKQQSSDRSIPLSLQDKLDRISYERDVLAVRRDLARQGLTEGDTVLNADNGQSGVVVVVSNGALPYCAVRLENGSELPFDASHWSRALR